MAEQERNAPRGLFRTSDEWAMVEYGNHQMSIPRQRYEEQDYEPPFELLPLNEN